MRLARITLNGFKSFADHTEFRFDDPITGVVGPNGCGKSNVVDAIKWVLGERSAKTLRGKEMADVIFAGSAGRAPAGMAAVSLVFENPELDPQALQQPTAQHNHAAPDTQPNTTSDDEHDTTTTPAPDNQHNSTPDDDAEDEKAAEIGIDRANRRRHLAIDTEEVAVERRLYRDGKSQYLINGRIARLRDIRELFLDTGVGADAYSIIEQGKVDAMLLANPTERRAFFEEAAGIARFKARRTEAQRKLERTETNLVRTREQLESAERRLRTVRGQAAKARRFAELDAELQATRLALAFDRYDELRRKRIDLEAQTAAIEDDRARLLDEVATLEEQKQQAELVRHELQRARDERRHEAESATQRQSNAEQRAAIAQRNLDEANRQLESERQREQQLEDRIAALEAEATASTQTIEQLQRDLAAAEQALDAAARARESAQSALADTRIEAQRARAAANALDRERAQATTRLESEERRLAAAREQTDALQARREELDGERENTEAAHAQLEERAEELTEITAELERNLHAKLASATSLSDDQRAVAAQLDDLEREWTRLDSRKQTLDEMAAKHAGLGDATRKVLERRDRHARDNTQHPLYTRVLAPLAERIEVAPQHATAVEAALGNAIGAILLDAGLDALTAATNEHFDGRVVFTTTHNAAAPNSQHDTTLATTIRPLASLVNALDEHAARVVNRLLANTFLAPSLDAATLLLAGPMPGSRFVTHDGTLLEPDGRVAIGPLAADNQAAGILERASERRAIAQRLQRLRKDIDERRAALRSVDERAQRLDNEMGELRDILAQRNHETTAIENERERLNADAERTHRERLRTDAERNESTARAAKLENEVAQLKDAIAALQTRYNDADEHAASREQHAEALTQKADAATETRAAARVAAAEAEQRHASAEREARRLNHQLEDAREQRTRTADAIAYRESKADEEHAAIRDALAESERAKQEHAAASNALASLADELTDATDRLYRIGEQLAQTREHAAQVNSEWNRIELAKRENDIHTENAERRTADELAADLHAEYPEYRELIADGGVTPIERDAAEREAHQLHAAIKHLGNVNLDAIDEESELEDRNEALIAQVADIDNARAQLEQLIERLGNLSRERFRESFQTIRDTFSGDRGMFRKLFGGGRAEVELIPHEETGEIDWLESGIRVTAKPPGKEPRAISQLSGGEKTMTAVALLLAIFESKPSPFCVLDEVDAALDDANVERFGAVVQQFLDRCHFVVITHNKRTMRIADTLYGVTMQERGVSKRVAVRFEDVNESGEIRHGTKRTQPERHTTDRRDTEHHLAEPKPTTTRFSDALRAGAHASA